MKLSGVNQVQSKIAPTVVYSIRVLNQIARAERDMGILDKRAEYLRAVSERAAILKPVFAVVPPAQIKEADSDKETKDQAASRMAANRRAEAEEQRAREEAFASAPGDVQARSQMLADKERVLFSSVLMPAVIKAALVSVSGLSVDGVQVTTPESFLAAAPDELLGEAYAECERASGLTAEQQKN